MKIFNTKKRRDWTSYGISIENDSIVMSSFSEIKSSFSPNENDRLLVLISKNLSLPVIIVMQGDKKENKEIVEGVQLAYDTFRSEVDVLSIMTNKVDAKDALALKKLLQKQIVRETSRGDRKLRLPVSILRPYYFC